MCALPVCLLACRWCLNDESFYKPSSPILLDVWFRTTGEEDRNPLIVELRDSEVVDVLLQNARGLNDVSEQHPWHIHGHVRQQEGGTRRGEEETRARADLVRLLPLLWCVWCVMVIRASGCWARAWACSTRPGTPPSSTSSTRPTGTWCGGHAHRRTA